MKKKVLVVDNDQDTVDIITYLLQENGYEVIGSLSANVIQEIPQIKPDLILLDNWLDCGYGSEICMSLKSNEDTGRIPVIIMSAANRLKMVANECNADNYLEKPFDVEELSRLVASTLKATTASKMNTTRQ